MAGEYEGENFFDQALKESGVKVISNDSAATEQQEQQTTVDATDVSNTTEESTTLPTSEMQEEVQQEAVETNTQVETENPAQDVVGESESKSGFIDLNQNEEEPIINDESETQFNISEMFGGEYQDLDQVKSVLSEYNDLKAKVKEYEEQKSPYANEFIQKMNEYALQGGDPLKFAVTQGIDADKLSPMDALSLDLQWQHGITEEEAKSYINQKYNIDDYDSDSGEVNPSAVQLKIDANNARKNIKDRQADNTLVTPNNEGMVSKAEIEQYEKEREAELEAKDNLRMWDKNEGWATEVDKAFDGLKSKGFIIDLGNGKGFKYSFDKNEDYVEQLISRVDQALYDSGLTRRDNPKLAHDIMNNLFFLDNKAEIMKAYGDQISSMKTEEYHKMYNNPSPIQRGTPIEQGSVKSAEEQLASLWRG